MEVVLDFETINCGGIDLTKVGSTVYAQHPLTEVVSLTYLRGEEPVVWKPGDKVFGFLYQLAELPSAIFVAHSAGFEKDIWRYIMVRIYGFPDIPNERWRDTQAVCAWKAIPINLEGACDTLELENRKDPDGHKLMRSITKPNKQGEFNVDPQILRSVYTYNRRDILCQSELHSRLGVLSPSELSVWQLDQKINERGIQIDTNYCRAAMEVVRKASLPLLKEFEDLTGLRPGQRDKLMTWSKEQGQKLLDLTKETVEYWIGSEENPYWQESKLPPKIARALRIRQLVNHSSTKKLQRMIDCTAEDGRAHRLVQYHGAGPGRWTGRLFQPQNFPRGTVRIPDKDGKPVPPPPQMLVDAIMTGDPKYVEMVIGSPAIECVASGLRHGMVAARGHVFNSGDFSGIECRIDLALAGQQDKCLQLASGQDVYCDMATQIYGRKITKADTEQRQIGKNTVLGCGFQMGWEKFKLRYCPHQPDEFAQNVIKTYRNEWAPLVPKLWRGLENAALSCVQTKQPQEAYGVVFRMADPWLCAELPSGNCLWYFKPKLIQKVMPWTDQDGDEVIKPAWQFHSWSGEDGRLCLTDAYGGMITENVVQAMARQLMIEAMYLCEKENFPIVLTVHDEILTEPTRGDLKALEQIMTCRPAWAKRIQVPIQIESWENERYKK